MLFHEIYGYYYQTVAAILDLAVNGELNDRRLAGIVSEKAFGESALVIPQSLKDGTWPLLDEDGTMMWCMYVQSSYLGGDRAWQPFTDPDEYYK